MKTRLWLLLAAVTLHTFALAEEWKQVNEIAVTLPTGTSLAAQGHYVRVSFLKDGTAVKRDLTEATVYTGTIAQAIYENLAKAVVEPHAFTVLATDDPAPAKDVSVNYNGEKRKLRVPYKGKSPALVQIEAAIDLIRWKKM